MGRHKSPARKRPDPITEKQCSNCGEIKDVSLFGKYYGGKMRSADGYRAMCNQCRALKQKQARARAKGDANA